MTQNRDSHGLPPQGICTGGEISGVSTYLAEHKDRGILGMLSATLGFGGSAGFLAASAFVLFLHLVLTDDEACVFSLCLCLCLCGRLPVYVRVYVSVCVAGCVWLQLACSYLVLLVTRSIELGLWAHVSAKARWLC